MLDNIGGYAVDKAKFWIDCKPQELSIRMEEWLSFFGGATGPQGGKVYNVQSVKRGEREGSFWYAFDVWGEAASQIDSLDFETWYPYLDRIDLKTTMPMTEQGRDNYEDYLSEKLAGKRSVGKLTSPTRQKRGNRDAGGHTLTIGSHKSDFRVHWTLRGGEEGYQEYQLQGTRITMSTEFQRLVASKQEQYKKDYGWHGLCRMLLTRASIELSDLDGLYDTDRAKILAGAEDVHGIMENKLAYIESYINRLPNSALFGLYDALTEKLFGTPPEAGDNQTDDDDDDLQPQGV